jgi:hypothetical protein
MAIPRFSNLRHSQHNYVRRSEIGEPRTKRTFATQPDISTLRGINLTAGCVVIVRPDQHVAHVLPIDAHAQIAAFFARFMLEPESVSPVR